MTTGKHHGKRDHTRKKGEKRKERGDVSTFIHRQSHHLVASLRYLSLRRLMKATFADVLFYLFVFTFGLIFVNFISVKSQELMPAVDLKTFKDTGAMDTLINSFNTLMGIFFVVAVTYFLLVVVFWAIFKGALWSLLMKRNITVSHVLNYFWLSLLWLGIWTVVIVGALSLLKESFVVGAVMVLVFIFVHTSIPVYIVFTKENKIRHAIREGMSIAVGKAHHFLVPYSFIVIFYMAVLAGLFFPLLGMLPNAISGIVSALLTILYLVWCRVYLLEMIAYHAGYQMR